MRNVKIHHAEPTAENLFVTILRWYLIGSVAILVILTVIELLIR